MRPCGKKVIRFCSLTDVALQVERDVRDTILKGANLLVHSQEDRGRWRHPV